MSEELVPVVTEEDEALNLWRSRKRVLSHCIKDACARDLVNEYLEHLAMSKPTKVFLSDRGITWAELNSRLQGTHYKLVKAALAIGSRFKMQIAEDELLRRSIEGVEEPIYQGGELVGYKRRYSDTLLSLLLKAENPDKYSDKQQVQVSGAILKVNVTGVERSPVIPI